MIDARSKAFEKLSKNYRNLKAVRLRKRLKAGKQLTEDQAAFLTWYSHRAASNILKYNGGHGMTSEQARANAMAAKKKAEEKKSPEYEGMLSRKMDEILTRLNRIEKKC